MWRLVCVAVLAAVLVPAAGAAVPTSETHNPVWSPDGSRLAYVRTVGSTGRVFVISPTGSELRALTPPQRLPLGLSWSSDGRALSYVSDGDIWRVDLTGQAVQLTDTPTIDAWQTAWSPDGATIAFTAGGGPCIRCTNVYGIDADGGNVRVLRFGGRRAAWSPDGSVLLTSVPVSLVDVATGEAQQVSFGWSASWSHDGAEFAYADSDGLFVGTPAAATARLVRPGGRVGFSAISPSRDRIAFVRGKRVRILHRASRREVLLERSDAGHDAPSWSIRGRLAFVAAGPCGRRSQIDVVRADGSGRRVLVRACSRAADD